MKVFIDYFLFVVNYIISILDKLKIGNYSILYYMLGAIIIGFIIKLVKGSANEFDHSMNFTTGYVIDRMASRYSKKHDNRKQQIINEKYNNKSYNPNVEIPPILRSYFNGAKFTRLKDFNDFEKEHLR